MLKQEVNLYEFKVDDTYGFDYAVYPKQKDEQHKHSIALLKKITAKDQMRMIQKWIKICHSVKKQLWLEFQGKIQKLKLSFL